MTGALRETLPVLAMLPTTTDVVSTGDEAVIATVTDEVTVHGPDTPPPKQAGSIGRALADDGPVNMGRRQLHSYR